MKKILFLGACLVAMASQPVLAQTTGPEVVIMEVYYVSFADLHIVISRGPGKTETTEVRNRGTEQVEAVQNTIATFYREGYSLKGTYSPGTGNRSSFIFVKGQ